MESLTHVVGFVSKAGTILVSHYCIESDVDFWLKQGYIVWRLNVNLRIQ